MDEDFSVCDDCHVADNIEDLRKRAYRAEEALSRLRLDVSTHETNAEVAEMAVGAMKKALDGMRSQRDRAMAIFTRMRSAVCWDQLYLDADELNAEVAKEERS